MIGCRKSVPSSAKLVSTRTFKIRCKTNVILPLPKKRPREMFRGPHVCEQQKYEKSVPGGKKIRISSFCSFAISSEPTEIVLGANSACFFPGDFLKQMSIFR